ncbi:MAG: type II toxin-antitoxin system VapC family toxin [Acidimicrobiales bacterium]
MIVLDADVLIGYLDNDDAHHDSAISLLEREIDDDFVASSLTLAEVLVGPTRAGRVLDAVHALRDLEVSEEPLPADAAVKLAELRAATGLRMPDCCVLFAARERQARVASWDVKLKNAARKSGLTVVTS